MTVVDSSDSSDSSGSSDSSDSDDSSDQKTFFTQTFLSQKNFLNQQTFFTKKNVHQFFTVNHKWRRWQLLFKNSKLKPPSFRCQDGSRMQMGKILSNTLVTTQEA